LLLFLLFLLCFSFYRAEPSPKRLREDDPDLNLSYGDLEAGDDLNLTYEDTDQQYQEPEPSEGDGQ
jgi:hypothetical protein